MTRALAGVASRAYSFAPSMGWLAHLWKSATRQDHAGLLPLLERVLPVDGIALDVGAHGGQVTRLLAGRTTRGRVIAIEPSGYARSILRLALWARGVTNVAVIGVALGERRGMETLTTPLKRNGDVRYGLARVAEVAGEGPGAMQETVVVMTLDDLVEGLGLERVDFIKVDIEGHEAAFIEGAQRTLVRFLPVLVMEHEEGMLSRPGSDGERLRDRMIGMGYQPHRLCPTGAMRIDWEHRDLDVVWMPVSRDRRSAARPAPGAVHTRRCHPASEVPRPSGCGQPGRPIEMVPSAAEARLLGIRLMEAQAAHGPEEDSATDVTLRREMELRRQRRKNDDDDGGRELAPGLGGV